MSKSKILVTGSAGFIGYHLCKSLLDDNYEVLGIDNLNDYYDTNLKNSRLDRLKHYNKFRFEKIDISDRSSLGRLFKSYIPNKVINLAAQAGVRYSIQNPYAYMDSNLVGFLNIIELCRQYNSEGLIYASSSSVYGNSINIPYKESNRADKPIALYGATKRANEMIAYAYSKLYNINTTGLRYFTVYGPWGRPDMAMYIFTQRILAGKKIPVYNNGAMKRDFTYIDDIIFGTRSAIEKNYPLEIFNLGNNKSEDLMKMINLIEIELGITAKIDFQPIQPGDVKQSFANIDKSREILRYNPKTSIEKGIPKFIEWYKSYHK